ncbi:MAG: hypothetical protein KDD70_15130, partial [Bdellovibrionales bacterium]|nr:hypothetical protein [Bdellovibrionales bacterium]
MLIETLPIQFFSHLEGREWGYLDCPPQDLPDWVKGMPQEERLKFLASGVEFECVERDKKLISSEELLGDTKGLSAQPSVLPDSHDDWYLLMSDENFDNILITDCISDQAFADWVRALKKALPFIQVYLVP